MSDTDAGANGLVRRRLDGPSAAHFELVPTAAVGEKGNMSRVAHYTARTRARLDRESMFDLTLTLICSDSPADATGCTLFFRKQTFECTVLVIMYTVQYGSTRT